MTTAKSDLKLQGQVPPKQKLLVCCPIQLTQKACAVTFRRTMQVVTQDGNCVGMVAAVVLDCPSQQATHLLLGYVPPTGSYRLIPVHLIDRLDGKIVWLRSAIEDIDHLPIFQTG